MEVVTPDDKILAQRFLDFLRKSRERGETSATVHVTADEIIARAGKHGIKLNDSKIRKYTNYLRDEKQPICSDGTGYWFALKSDELDSTIHHLRGRLKEIAEAVRKIEELKSDMEKRETNIFQYPVIKAIQEQFEAKVI